MESISDRRKLKVFVYKTLESISIETLHKTFLNAFSDYQVKLELPLEKFEQMLKRSGYDRKACIGAFENDELIGFILNGIRKWNGRVTAYDTGTAVIEMYRKKGITSNMFQNARELFKEMRVEQYLLEVIQTNTSAVELYKKQGFKILRDLECFYLDKSKYSQRVNYKVEHMDMINQNIWRKLIEFWDFTPSWQNSIESINAVSDTLIYSIVYFDDMIVGYGVIDIKTGDIPQLAVDKKYRHKGIGKSIVTDLINNTESNKISILNVDGKCESMKDFLIKSAFESKIKQYEMSLEL